MKLSIIIPIYNVEMYIARCLFSCIHQDVRLGVDYEIICINDGTKDNSAVIAKEIAEDYNGIVVIDQENQGLSMARNNGLEKANGEYVWFVDSDDWICENCLGRIINRLGDGIDIFQLQYMVVYDEEKYNYVEPYTIISGIKTGREVTLNGGLPAPAQFSIFRTDFLRDNDLKFVSGIYHEDSEFKPRAVYLAEGISADTEVSYNYYKRTSGNIMSSFSIKRAKDIIYVNNSLWRFSQNLDNDIRRALNLKISTNLNSLFAGYNKLGKDERREVVSMLKANKHMFLCMKECDNLKYNLEGHFFYLNIKCALFLYNFFKL